MSTSYYAYVVVGVGVPREKTLLKEEPYFSCGHDGAARSNFCPECGVKKKSEKEYIFDDDSVLGGGIGVFVDEDSDYVYVGKIGDRVGGYDSWHQKFDIGNIDGIKEKVKKELSKYDLWNEADFGVHLFMVAW